MIMKIAAQQIGKDLKVFIEGATWKKATLPLNNQVVKIDLVVFINDEKRIFHDTCSRPDKPDTDPTLKFCREAMTITDLKKNLKKAGYSYPPHEVRLSSPLFSLKKEYLNAYYLKFEDYINNPAFTEWLSSFPALEGDFLLQRVNNTGRYYSKDCSEFSEYAFIRDYIRDRFVLWYDATIKDYEVYLAQENINK
jgi:hypothetical protein